MSPVEVFVTRIKIFDQQKLCLLFSSEALDCLIFKQVKGQFAAMCSSRSWSQTQNQPQCGSLSVYWKRYIYVPDEVWGRDYHVFLILSSEVTFIP